MPVLSIGSVTTFQATKPPEDILHVWASGGRRSVFYDFVLDRGRPFYHMVDYKIMLYVWLSDEDAVEFILIMPPNFQISWIPDLYPF